jgi:hypothetical protein
VAYDIANGKIRSESVVTETCVWLVANKEALLGHPNIRKRYTI